jgi:hypothetical protein
MDHHEDERELRAALEAAREDIMNENPMHFVGREVVAYGVTPAGALLRAQGVLDGYEVASKLIEGSAAPVPLLTLYLRLVREEADGETTTITTSRPSFRLTSARLYGPGDEPETGEDEDDDEPAVEYDDDGVEFAGRPLVKSWRPNGHRSAAEYKAAVRAELVGPRPPEGALILGDPAEDDGLADLYAAHEPEWMQDDGGER